MDVGLCEKWITHNLMFNSNYLNFRLTYFLLKVGDFILLCAVLQYCMTMYDEWCALYPEWWECVHTVHISMYFN